MIVLMQIATHVAATGPLALYVAGVNVFAGGILTLAVIVSAVSK